MWISAGVPILLSLLIVIVAMGILYCTVRQIESRARRWSATPTVGRSRNNHNHHSNNNDTTSKFNHPTTTGAAIKNDSATERTSSDPPPFSGNENKFSCVVRTRCDQ